MSLLNDIIRRVADDHDGPSVVISRAIPVAVGLILENEEATKLAVTETANRRLTQALTRRSREISGKAGRQGTFFGDLRERYAIDVEERVIKQTVHLTREEFYRVMEIRRTQIAADRAHLAVLEHAAAELEIIWDANPTLPFGEVERLFAKPQPARRPTRRPVDQPGAAPPP